MRLAVIADVFPPLRSSGAVQLRDLLIEFTRQGHQVTMMVAAPELSAPWKLEDFHGVRVIRLKTPKTKDVGYVRRTLGEFLMPFFMWFRLRKSHLANEKWDGVVWYSPTIFLGPIVRLLKADSQCRSYLIVRDIFPEWALDMGLLKKGPAYWFFKAVANYQYSVADVIGVQAPGNKVYFSEWLERSQGRLEVLQNWLENAPNIGCKISIADTPLAGRKILVYAGNMGIAQGMGMLIDLAEQLRHRSDVGFVFVGRGSDAKKIRSDAQSRGLDNTAFFDEIEPEQITGLYAQCHAGLVALDPRHKTHNIPGKFLSYMQAGLPVLASVNPGNDIVPLIASERVGHVCTDGSVLTLKEKAERFLEDLQRDEGYASRCKSVSEKNFSPSVAVRQIIEGLRPIF